MVNAGSLSNKQKLDIVIQRNTFFFRSADFEEQGEARISSITSLLLFYNENLPLRNLLETRRRL